MLCSLLYVYHVIMRKVAEQISVLIKICVFAVTNGEIVNTYWGWSVNINSPGLSTYFTPVIVLMTM